MTEARRTLERTGKAQAAPDAIRLFDEAHFVHPRPPAVPIGSGFSGGYGAYELARVWVPKDSVGVLRLIWQYVAGPSGEMTGPLFVDLPGADLTWHLCTEDGMKRGPLRTKPDRMNVHAPTGRLAPYGELLDLRFPWGSDVSIKAIVQEHTTLSLWANVRASGAEFRVLGGRLLGYVQSGQSAHAVGNLVAGF